MSEVSSWTTKTQKIIQAQNIFMHVLRIIFGDLYIIKLRTKHHGRRRPQK